MDIAGHSVTVNVWKAAVGRIVLYLLDANVPSNRPEDRDVTCRLYGGDQEMRIKQEIILGIGGMRALAALGIEPSVCHMNEGHSAFLAIERVHQRMKQNNPELRGSPGNRGHRHGLHHAHAGAGGHRQPSRRPWSRST